MNSSSNELRRSRQDKTIHKIMKERSLFIKERLNVNVFPQEIVIQEKQHHE
jgi:hypothetical protein